VFTPLRISVVNENCKQGRHQCGDAESNASKQELAALPALNSGKALHQPHSSRDFIWSSGSLRFAGRLTDRSRDEEDGIMRPFEAICLDCICCYGFARKVLDRGPFAFRPTLLRPRALMGGEGVSD
jgi:hypothetical protein